MVEQDKMDVASNIILKHKLPEGRAFMNIAENACDVSKLYYHNRLYFFFNSELALKKDDKTSMRHLTRYNNGFYDYIAKKEYKSLSEWAADNGKTLNDILYGLNRDTNCYDCNLSGYVITRIMSYISLVKLLQYLDPSYIGEPVTEVKAIKKGVSVFEFNGLLTQLDAIRSTVESMKMRLD